MIAFIVATPLQIYNSLVIARHHFPSEKIDFIALDIVKDLRPYFDNYKHINNIDEVYYLYDICKHCNTPVGIVFDHVINSKDQKSFLNKINGKEYSDLFFTSVGLPATWIYSKLKKRNPNIKLHFYEEGLGIYLYNLFGKYHKLKYVYDLLNYYPVFENISSIYVYEPELCEKYNNIPKVRIGTVTGEDINALCNEKIADKIIPYEQGGAIYLENSPEGLAHFCQELILDKLCDILNKEKILIRLHPRTKVENYSEKGYSIDLNTELSWEDLISHNEIVEMTIITAISAAVFTPKIIFGKEPQIIILGKAIKNLFPDRKAISYLWNDDMQRFVEAIRKIYTAPDRVIVPEHLDDLKEMITIN